MNTDIVVFAESDPDMRAIVYRRGGWLSWKAEDGWWSRSRFVSLRLVGPRSV
ncbi:hypothetical protein LINPERPRIM_LOCUS11047 [Linum perenne]